MLVKRELGILCGLQGFGVGLLALLLALLLGGFLLRRLLFGRERLREHVHKGLLRLSAILPGRRFRVVARGGVAYAFDATLGSIEGRGGLLGGRVRHHASCCLPS